MRKFVLWLMILVIAAAMGGSVVYAVRPYVDAARALSQITGVKAGTNALPTFTPAPSPTVSLAHPTAAPTATAIPIRTPKNRVNFLILASDNDSKGHQAGDNSAGITKAAFPNTQVMIFVSFDPVHKQVYLISIPRDLWVNIPGYGMDKIDIASGYGDVNGAIQTVEDNFGVKIDHYAWVGLNGFIKIINSVGGLDVNVIHPMVENDFPDDIDHPNSPYDYRRFSIPPGPQHLDGVTAEEYVRARHSDQLSDFGRSQRQQQVLLLLKQKLQQRVAQGDFDLAALVAQDLRGEALTDMHLPDILGLAHSLLGLKSSQIHRWVLTNGYATDRVLTLPNGQKPDVLQPNWDRIRPLFACVDSDQAITGCPGL